MDKRSLSVTGAGGGKDRDTGRRRASPNDASADALAKMGYQSELPRNLSMLSVLGMSFAIMAVPFGLSTTLYITLTDGQSVTILYGWILVSLISLCIAASLAEICAVYPTAGGVYYWSAMLSTREWAPIASWVTGWLTLVGNWTVTLSINFSGGQLILSAITLWNEDFVPNQWQTVLAFWAVMLICMSVNIFGAKHLDLINKVCIYWTASSVIIILITVLSMADQKRDAKFVFTHYDASKSGWYVPLHTLISIRQWELMLMLTCECAGRQDGLSSSASCKLPTRLPATEWWPLCAKKCRIPNAKCPKQLFSPSPLQA
jgi:amino acid transporter